LVLLHSAIEFKLFLFKFPLDLIPYLKVATVLIPYMELSGEIYSGISGSKSIVFELLKFLRNNVSSNNSESKWDRIHRQHLPK